MWTMWSIYCFYWDKLHLFDRQSLMYEHVIYKFVGKKISITLLATFQIKYLLLPKHLYTLGERNNRFRLPFSKNWINLIKLHNIPVWILSDLTEVRKKIFFQTTDWKKTFMKRIFTKDDLKMTQDQQPHFKKVKLKHCLCLLLYIFLSTFLIYRVYCYFIFIL